MDAKTLCLGALMHQDASGYEIRKLYEEGPYSCFHAVSFGSIYPALNQMLADGLVTVREMVQEGRPDKKVYAITERGRDAFIRGLNTEPAPDRFRSDMLFILSFGQLLPRERRTELLDRYVAEHQRMIAELQDPACDCQDAPAGGRFVRDFGLAIYDTIVRYIAENRHILEAAEAERAPVDEETP
ncbi:PadR family transcriptional regulator [Novispirillum sp. DQ9]|uniref:PadR family transcriptional regulator n=1 Tax=Novispirillum sp. DQ9 TaxID=3398612 RepID=UPI003C7B03C8